jgi:hypothetical protein
VIEKLDGMPPGTFGFRATGSVTADEYREVLLPGMRDAKAMHMFGWMTPGEVKLYDLDGLEDAKAWVAERP